MHDDELEVTEELVRRLVARDAPQFAGVPVERLTSTGSTNVLFRLGDDAVIRFPRQPGGSGSIEKEAAWSPALRSALTVSVPEPIALGEPGFGYPERWSIVRWLPGRHPAVPEPRAAQLVRALARFVRELRAVEVPTVAVGDPALRSYRGSPLAAVDAEIRAYLEQCKSVPGLDLDLDVCTRIWDEAVALPADGAPARWLHGDLLAENLLVDEEHRLAAVLDLGALAVGDPTVDLVVAWEVLPTADREIFRAEVGADATTWLRGRAWALAIAVMTFPYYWNTMPGRCADRLVMARAVVDDFERNATT